MSGSRMALGGAAAARTACARVLVRGGTDEKTGEALSAAAVAERAGWCAALVKGMAARLVSAHWDAVRAAVPGGEHLPSAVIRARTRQVARCLQDQGRLPVGVTALEGPPRVPAMLILAACDKQQAGIERHETDPAIALLRVQLPVRPDPRSYRDWSWVSLPLALPPTVPAAAALHLPTLRAAGGRVLADVAFTHLVPRAKRTGQAGPGEGAPAAPPRRAAPRQARSL